MGRRPRPRCNGIGSDSKTSSVSFRMDSNEASVDCATDMTDSDFSTSPSGAPKRQGRARGQRRSGQRGCFTKLTISSKASLTACLSASGSARVDTGRTTGNLDQDSDLDESSNSSSDNSYSDPDVKTDNDESSDNNDNRYSDSTKIGINQMRDQWEQ